MEYCALCQRKVNKSRPYISGGDEIEIIVHVSCLYTAKPVDILRMLQIEVAFYFMTGEHHISLAEMSTEVKPPRMSL